MTKLYCTLTGFNHYFGNEFLKRHMKVQLIKEPDNKYDKEAIRCELEPLGKIGYVANSVGTIPGNCWSGGRLYDKIGDKTEATVELILDRGAVLAVEAAEPEKPAAEPKPEETTAQTAAAEETLEEKQLGQMRQQLLQDREKLEKTLQRVHEEQEEQASREERFHQELHRRNRQIAELREQLQLLERKNQLLEEK